MSEAPQTPAAPAEEKGRGLLGLGRNQTIALAMLLGGLAMCAGFAATDIGIDKLRWLGERVDSAWTIGLPAILGGSVAVEAIKGFTSRRS